MPPISSPASTASSSPRLSASSARLLGDPAPLHLSSDSASDTSHSHESDLSTRTRSGSSMAPRGKAERILSALSTVKRLAMSHEGRCALGLTIAAGGGSLAVFGPNLIPESNDVLRNTAASLALEVTGALLVLGGGALAYSGLHAPPAREAWRGPQPAADEAIALARLRPEDAV